MLITVNFVYIFPRFFTEASHYQSLRGHERDIKGSKH